MEVECSIVLLPHVDPWVANVPRYLTEWKVRKGHRQRHTGHMKGDPLWIDIEQRISNGKVFVLHWAGDDMLSRLGGETI